MQSGKCPGTDGLPAEVYKTYSFQNVNNVRRLFDIVYAPTPSDTAEMVISMDAEKAFDRVEWSYLFSL